MVLQQWMSSVRSEETEFTSGVLELNSLLAKAKVFSKPLGYPNRLLAAVAFHILDHATSLYSR